MNRHIHLGLGRFHKAHQAFYLQQVGWNISAFSMRSSKEADALRAGEFRYALEILGPGEKSNDTITAIDQAFFIQQETDQFWSLISNPDIRTLTLTITEKGYSAPPDDEMDRSTCALFYLVQGLAKRQSHHSEPINLISCDNLVGNGRLLESLCRAWAKHLKVAVDFTKVSFPNTMVDRIVPAGDDPLLVSTEQFHQWVIEDCFLGHRPEWEQPGVYFASKVQPFEAWKLGLLNASHSLMAYYGQICGHEYVHQAVNDPHIREMIETLYFEEVGPLLETPQGLNLADYGGALLSRFNNPHLPHKLAQIAMDGSQKVPQRFLPHIEQSKVLKLAYSAWFSYMWFSLTGTREYRVSDPNATLLKNNLGDGFDDTVARWKDLLAWPDYSVQLLDRSGSDSSHRR